VSGRVRFERRQRAAARRLIAGAPPATQEQVAQRRSEVTSCRDEDEEVASVLRQRQTADDVLERPVIEVPRPRDVSEHLRPRDPINTSVSQSINQSINQSCFYLSSYFISCYWLNGINKLN